MLRNSSTVWWRAVDSSSEFLQTTLWETMTLNGGVLVNGCKSCYPTMMETLFLVLQDTGVC